jgi:pimeloyl-ACP methyl ester carboxylesterase
VDHYARIAQQQSEPPILIGHSFGGLFVQMLLDRGLGFAGVAISPAPPRGVLPGPNAVRASLPVLM